MLGASKSHLQSIKVIEILEQNKDGLTSHQIASLLGERIRGGVLYRLQKDGKIEQKKALLTNSNIGFVYVLNKRK